MTKHAMTRLADLMAAQASRSGLDIDVAKIAPDPEQPRQRWDQAGLQGLADSIAARGVVQPLVVRSDPQTTGHFIIVAGERRWRAARLAGLAKVPAILKDVTADERLAMQLVENLDREDLHILDEARCIQRLGEDHNLSGRAIARLLGKPESWVSQRRKLAQHAEVLVAYVDDTGTRDVETLTQLADLSQLDRGRFDALVSGGRVSRLAAKRALDEARAPRHPRQKAPATPATPLRATGTPTPPDAGAGTHSEAVSCAPVALSGAALRALSTAVLTLDAGGRLTITLRDGSCFEVTLDEGQIDGINRALSLRAGCILNHGDRDSV
jgi:ParB family chromosome partitioning protein